MSPVNGDNNLNPRSNTESRLPEKFAYWMGIDRTEINWHPTIDYNKCTGCGMCFVSCGRGVFGYDLDKKRPYVREPLRCMVGCTSCETWCIFGAISFPDKEYIKNLIRNHGILKIVKEKLHQKFEERSN